MYNLIKAEIQRIFYIREETDGYLSALEWLKGIEKESLMNHQEDIQSVCCQFLWELYRLENKQS